MSPLFTQVRNGIIFSVTCLTCFGIAYAAISWPATPSGETAGGKFANVLNTILQSGDWKNPGDGTVKRAAKTATGGIQFPDGNTQTKAFLGVMTVRTNSVGSFTLSAGESVNYSAYCNAGEVATGGGCADGGNKDFYFWIGGSNYYQCGWYNTSGGTKNYAGAAVYVSCLK